MKKQKNGLIELMRFLFASTVILFHIAIDIKRRKAVLLNLGWFGKLTLARNGNACVEFFFLLSGLFMAKSIYDSLQKKDSQIPLGEETVLFIWNKAKRILAYYLPITLLAFLVRIILKQKFTFWELINYLPSFIFLQRTGISAKNFIGVAWYLSSMLIAMAIIYPICKKHYNMFTMVYGPLLGILLIGFLIKETGSLGKVTKWMGFTYKSNLRALAGVSLGTACYEIGRRLQQIEFKTSARVKFTLLGFIAYIIPFLYFYSNISGKSAGIIVLFQCVAIAITYGEAGILCHKGVFQKKLFYYLGRISLPMYLFQNIFRQLSNKYCKPLPKRYRVLLVYFATLLAAILFDLILNQIRKMRQKQSNSIENKSIHEVKSPK